MKSVLKTFLACCALCAAPAASPAAAACGCAVGAPDRTVFEYGCCDGETTLSETVTAPLTCGGAKSGLRLWYNMRRKP